MTREQIEKEARDYISDVYAGDGYFLPDYEEEVRDGFIAGAQWRIDSVWHDASEKYEIRLPSVVVFKNGRAAVYLDLRDVTYDGLWDEVKEYAYLKDLRPDRKEDER